MQTLILAAVLTGLLSLGGMCYILFSTYTNSASNVEVSTPSTSSSIEEKKDLPVTASEGKVENKLIIPQKVAAPSKTTMRKFAYALPAYSVVKKITLSFPTIKRQLIREIELQKQQELNEDLRLNEMEKNLFLDVDPPSAEEVPVTFVPPLIEKKNPEPIVKKNEPVAEPKNNVLLPVQKPRVPITTQAEKKILAQTEMVQRDENRKQEMLKAGGRLPVREMRKRFDGTLSAGQLSNVLNDIFGAKGDNDSDATCVHIKALPETEVTARQLSGFLISKGFIMAGRGEATTKDKGIKVDASGKCIVVTIGRIE